jgi:hypothetical protein
MKVEKRLCHGVLAMFKVIDGHATQTHPQKTIFFDKWFNKSLISLLP